ncbi:hypothetical protein V6N13_016746 [Hibiscus sabdariffa]
MVDDHLSFCCDLGGLVNNLKFLSRLVQELGSNVKVLALRKLTSTLQTDMDFFRERSCSLLLEVGAGFAELMLLVLDDGGTFLELDRAAGRFGKLSFQTVDRTDI